MIFGVTGHRDAGQKPGELERFAGFAVSRMQQAGCVDAQIPFVAALPFPHQQRRWTPDERSRYETLLAHAKRVWIAGKLPLTTSYHARDKLIVQNSSQLWALDSGRLSGTHTTVLFAEEIGCKVEHLWSRWTAFTDHERRIQA